jgi:hypothetical protein
MPTDWGFTISSFPQASPTLIVNLCKTKNLYSIPVTTAMLLLLRSCEAFQPEFRIQVLVCEPINR